MFGFGEKAGVDGGQRGVTDADKLGIMFNGPIYKAKPDVVLTSITCRMPKLQ